jgi:hypothetical protein
MSISFAGNSPRAIYRVTIHHAQSTAHNSPRKNHRAQFTANNAPRTIPCAQFSAHNSLRTILRAQFNAAQFTAGTIPLVQFTAKN